MTQRLPAMRGRMWLALLVCITAMVALRAQSAAQDPQPRITVMTWNIYSGGDFGNLLDGGSLANAMGDMFESVQDTDFLRRARSIAAEIDEQRPHVIGLQEVADWSADDFVGSGGTEIDFIQILQNQLALRGLNYDVIGSLTAIDFSAPGTVDGDLRDITWVERIVVMVRHSSQIHVTNVRTRRYSDTHSINIPVVGDLEFRRGWIAADITYRGSRFRFVNTHLESLDNSVQVNQADQLINWLSSTSLPVVLVGDMNVVAGLGTPATYDHLTAAGYTDAWAVHNPLFSGPTCCQDGDLANDSSQLTHRIDLVMTRGPITTASTTRVGQRPADRTSTGLWPSDHAGVVARLDLP